jgi:hypothetical protein
MTFSSETERALARNLRDIQQNWRETVAPPLPWPRRRTFSAWSLEELDAYLNVLFDRLEALAALSDEPNEEAYDICDELAAVIAIVARRQGRRLFVEPVDTFPVNSPFYSVGGVG